MDVIVQSITPFHVLLGTISSQLVKADVSKLKTQLQGHLNKECLDGLVDGSEVIKVLYQRGLINDKKLAFLRRLLVECHLGELVELVDDFKKSSTDGQSKNETSRTRKRLHDLQVIIARLQEEMKNYENIGQDLKDFLSEKGNLLDSQKEHCINQQESVDSLNDKLETSIRERDLMEEHVAESDEVIKLQEKELKTLQDTLKNSRLNLKRNSQNRVSIFDKHSNDKRHESLEKETEDKAETLRKYKETNETTLTLLYSERKKVRQFSFGILEETKNLINTDEEILQTYEEMRKIRQKLRQNDVDVWDLKYELEDTDYEFQKSHNQQALVKTSTIPTERLQDISKQKVINYQDVLEDHSYFLGCYGNKMDTLQFDCPVGIAVTRDDVIFVADKGNCRVRIIDQLGHDIKEALTMNNSRPTALAANKRGNIITTDSQIIKVFTSDGMLSHNFLPVYNKKDKTPKISALAVDKDGYILAADVTNHRIQKFRIDGNFVGFIGGPELLRTPCGVAVSKQGDVIVSEHESHQLKVFHHHGRSFDTIGGQGIGKSQFMYPRGLAIDNKGNILVADTMNHRVQVISMEGEYIATLGRLGSGFGCLDTPRAIAVNRRGHVFVADSGNHRITVFT